MPAAARHPMPIDLHAFISYAHIDNEPLEPGQPGWVTRFHAVLKTRLRTCERTSPLSR